MHIVSVKAVHLFPLIFFLALVGCVSPKRDPTLCELSANREAYAGRAVTVEGILFVAYHGSVIVDPRCGLGIGISWFEADLPWMREFDALTKRSGDEPLMATVRVTGIIERGKDTDLVGGRPWYLDLAKADVLEAYPVSEGEWDRFLDWLGGPHKEPFRASRLNQSSSSS